MKLLQSESRTAEHATSRESSVIVIHCHTRGLCTVKYFNGVMLCSIFMNDFNEKIGVCLAGTEITLKDTIRNPNYLDKLGKSLTKYMRKLSAQMLLNSKKLFHDLVGINARWSKMLD